MSWPPDVDLVGRHARLAVTVPDHAAGLREAVADLQGLWYTSIPTPEGIPAEIERRRALRSAGTMLPFTVIVDERPVGMTTYMNIDAGNRRLEIGHTWLARRVQRSAVNTECKRMLLGHAFETLGCIAVEFRTHYLNRQSRAAIARLGAQLDGILRNHARLPDGSLRHTAVYSITAEEWPAVRNGLEARLASGV